MSDPVSWFKVSVDAESSPGKAGEAARLLSGDYLLGPSEFRWQIAFTPISGYHGIELVLSRNADGAWTARVALLGNGDSPVWLRRGLKNFDHGFDATLDEAQTPAKLRTSDWPKSISIAPLSIPAVHRLGAADLEERKRQYLGLLGSSGYEPSSRGSSG